MKKIEFTLRPVTPAFAGGAEEGKTDGIRPPTVKALLRFWWRTMKGGLTPEELFKKEAELFGSTDTGQGIRVIPIDYPTERKVIPANTKTVDLLDTYFAYGAVAWDKNYQNETGKKGATVTQRERLEAQHKLKFRLSYRDEHDDEINKSLWLLAVFGTLGGRSRRGWGSIALDKENWSDELPDPSKTNSLQELADCIGKGLKHIFPARFSGIPEFTAFSQSSRVCLGAIKTNGKAAHDLACNAYHDYHRQLGAKRNHGSVIGPDFSIRQNWLGTKPASGALAPHGVAFGLPQNAFFSTSKKKVDIGVGNEQTGRRASPVFFKVLEFGPENNPSFVPLMLWLPSVFLPSGTEIFVRTDSGSWYGAEPVGYPGEAAIQEFIDGTSATASAPLKGSASGTWSGLIGKGWKEVTW